MLNGMPVSRHPPARLDDARADRGPMTWAGQDRVTVPA
jgi:hypothetical protein